MQTEFLDPANERKAVIAAAHIIELKTAELRRVAIDQSPPHLRERIEFWVYTMFHERKAKRKKEK